MMWHLGASWLWMIVVWTVIVGLLVLVVLQLTPRRGDDVTRRSDAPQRILDERYARGEIDTAEYQRQRDELARP